MNKSIVSLCFIIVLSLHIIVFLNYKNKAIISSMPSENKTLLLQLSKVKEAQENTKITEATKVIKENQKELIKEKIIHKTSKKEIVKKNIIKEETKNIETPTQELSKSTKSTESLKNEKMKNKEPKRDINKHSKDLEKKIQQYINSYASELREKINKNKNYPSISKRLREEGTVIISFRVLNSGLFTNIKVSHSSNKTRLDKAALNALYDTKEYKVFDKEYLNKDFIDFELPLEFKLY